MVSSRIIFHLQGGMATYGWRMIGEEWREEIGKNCAAASRFAAADGAEEKEAALIILHGGCQSRERCCRRITHIILEQVRKETGNSEA